MKAIIALVLVALLHSEVAIGMDPTYDELQSQLSPITLTPNGGDQYFFFIVPVQKNDDPNIILQMAQAQDATQRANGSLASTKISTKDSSVNVSTNAENSDLNLDEVFAVPENGPDEFNFQVPVIVPLDFRFRYDPSAEDLPQCTVDSRTWREQVITRIAEKLDLSGGQTWNHEQITGRIRLHKDVLSSITPDYIEDGTDLLRYMDTITQVKYLSDIRYVNILNDITELTADYASVIGEGVDTYRLVEHAITLAEGAVADIGPSVDASIAQSQIDILKPSSLVSLAKFEQAYTLVMDLKKQAALEEEEIEI